MLAFRHPLTREVAYGGQLAEHRAATHAAAARATIELEEERLEELAGLVAHHMEEAGEDREAARWYSRAAHWAGHSQPREAMRLWRRVTELADRLERDPEAVRMSLFSRMLQLEFAWRLGIDREEFEALVAETVAIATELEDFNALTLLKLLVSARPGVDQSSAEWVEAIDDALELAELSGEPGLQVAVRAAGAYAFMCCGDLDRVEAIADEMLALTAAEPELGAGLVIASPRAWALTAKAMARRERDEWADAEQLIERALTETAQRGDLETESWALGVKAQLIADRGDIEAALALALRNRELTDRLGDVFSQTVALTMLSYVRLEAGEFEPGLADIERADREYREAMGTGGEMEAWRGTLLTKGLLCCGRLEEGLTAAEAAVTAARSRGMGWALPITLHGLAAARAMLDRDDVAAALDEAAALAAAGGHTMLLRRIEESRPVLVAA